MHWCNTFLRQLKNVLASLSLFLGSLGAAQLDLEWIDTATGETSYTVQWSAYPDYVPLLGSASLTADSETYTITGLENSTLYYVRIYSSNAKGDSDSLDGNETTVPANPSSLAASRTDGSKINLSWAEPYSGADSYKIEYKKSGDSTWTEFASGVTDISDTVSGLEGETSYDFRVRGTSAGGDGGYSNIYSMTTGVALPPLLKETFEGPESVVGVNGSADNSGWSANNTTVYFDYESSPISDNYSLQVIGETRKASYPISPAGTEIWIYFRFKGGNTSTFPEKFLVVTDKSGNECMRLLLRADLQEIYMRHGTIDESNGIDNWPGADIDYSAERHVRIQWEKGTGTDGYMKMWTSADGTFSEHADRTITTGDGHFAPAIVNIHGGSDAIVDNLLISVDEIGSNPDFGTPPQAPSGLLQLNP